MREHVKLFLIGASLLIAAGCSESSTSPTAGASRSLSASAPSFDYSGGGSYSFGDSRTDFVVTPSGGTYSLGGLFNVNFPSNSVCDPDLSSYGEGTWDSSCITLKRAIKITATVRLGFSGMAIDFQPDLRFSPDKQVTLSTDLFAPFIRANRDYFSRNPSALRPLALYYAPVLGGTAVPDYLTDPSLVTHIGLTSGRVWRRVKHFSGYVGTSGEPCDPGPDNPDCIAVDGDQ